MVEEYAIETGTITFNNGEKKITLKGNWKCSKESITAQGKKYSEVFVSGIEEPLWKGSLLDGPKEIISSTEAYKETKWNQDLINAVGHIGGNIPTEIVDKDKIRGPDGSRRFVHDMIDNSIDDLKTLDNLNCNSFSDMVVSLNKDKIVDKHSLREEIIKSLNRVYKSKAFDLIEKNAVYIWAKYFFNLKDGDFK